MVAIQFDFAEFGGRGKGYERHEAAPKFRQGESIVITVAKCTVTTNGWFRWAGESGSSFLRATAEAALLADLKHYNVLRPVLLELKEMYPENSWVLPLDARVGRAEH